MSNVNLVLNKNLLTVQYFKDNATIRYNSKPFEIYTDTVEIPNGLETNGDNKWYIKAEIPKETRDLIEQLNDQIRNRINEYWGRETILKFSDCFDYSKSKSEMFLKIKYRYKKFETKVFDISSTPASIYQLNKEKKAKLTISLGSAFRENENVLLKWTVDKIVYENYAVYS